MDALLYARSQMGLSLAFHIVFAAAGIALPLLMVMSDAFWLRTKQDEYLDLSKRLAKGTAILFAVGAVSGTVLSFELGLLWPSFMGTFGEVIGLPFAMEGFAFFTEAIFLGIYLYGRGRIPARFHLLAGIAVAVSGAMSAFFVTLVNSFMNDPAGIRMEGGTLAFADPLVAMFSPPWRHQVIHVLLSCYQAVAFAMAGIHAFVLLRHPQSTLHRKALGLALSLAVVTALAQPLSGDLSAKHIAERQPVKLAALEGHFETERYAPLRIGGIPDVEAGRTRWSIDIPGGLSFLAFGRFDAEVRGLNDFPRDEWPPVAATHIAFQVMVLLGMLMAALAVVTVVLAWKRRGVPDQRWFLKLVVAASPMGLIAMEAGWLVTEWGRQPWIVGRAMRTAEAVTPFPHLAAPFWIFTLVYLLLGIAVIFLLWKQIQPTLPKKGPADAAY